MSAPTEEDARARAVKAADELAASLRGLQVMAEYQRVLKERGLLEESGS